MICLNEYMQETFMYYLLHIYLIHTVSTFIYKYYKIQSAVQFILSIHFDHGIT